MKKLLLVSACALTILATGDAMAQTVGKRERATTGQSSSGSSYCLKTDIGPGDCKYQTMQQCQAALSGTGGDCVKNVGPR